MRLTVAFLLSFSAAAGAKKIRPAPPPPTAASGIPDYTAEQALAVARELCDRAGMSADRRETVLGRVRNHLFSPGWSHKYGAVRGVLVYQLGEGGFLVKGKKGSGIVRFNGGGDRTINLKGLSFGAQVGGGTEWGIGLVTGLGDPQFFGGDYSGSNMGGAAAVASSQVTVLRPKKGRYMMGAHHVIYMIGTGAGLSGGVATQSLSIHYD